MFKLDDLDLLVSSYTEAQFNLHLFTGYNELHLSKLDMIYRNPAYDYFPIIGLDKTMTVLLTNLF